MSLFFYFKLKSGLAERGNGSALQNHLSLLTLLSKLKVQEMMRGDIQMVVNGSGAIKLNAKEQLL